MNCTDCQTPLAHNPRRKGTRCQRCAARLNTRNPERAARIAESMRQWFAEPGNRELHKKRLAGAHKRAMCANPALRQSLRERGKRLGTIYRGQGAEAGSPARRAAARKQSEFYMSWCPLEYRDEYRALVRSGGVKAADARAMIEEQIAVDTARFLRTGQLQQSVRAPT